jgi:hypothetical protein
LPRLRLSLSIPGAVALGAYEGGALAALVVAAKELGEDVLVIDSIATAAAGSTAGLLAARALLEGIDPVGLLTAAWGETTSLGTAEEDAPDPPARSDALRAVAATLFGPDRIPSGPTPRRQEEPIWLSLALSPSDAAFDPTDLTGDTVTQPDWYIVTLTNAATPHEYLAYADAVIAAASDAVGAPVMPPDQPGDKRQGENTGHLGLPEDGLFWYTDGGTVDNEPLNRAIDLAENVASEDERLYLAINPDPAFPSRSLSDKWGDEAPSIYEALERLEEMGAHFERPGTALDDALEAARRRQTDIESVAGRILAERQADHSDDYASLLAAVVQSPRRPARRQVPVEVISPSIDPSVADPPSRQLVGAFFSHFGGHFDIALRQSDFCLGYRNMGYWLEHRLNSYLPYFDLSAALATVEREYDGIRWNGGRPGNARFSAPSFRAEAELGTHSLPEDRAIGHDLIVRET